MTAEPGQPQAVQTQQTTAPVPKSKQHNQALARLLGTTFLLVIWTGAVILAMQFVFAYLLTWILGQETVALPVPTAIYTALTYIISFIILWLVTPVLSRRLFKTSAKPSTRDELGLAGLPTWTDIGLGVLGFIISMVLAGILLQLFALFPWFNAGEDQALGFSPYIQGVDRIVAFITLVVVAPIAEELIFRGWLYGKLRAKFATSPIIKSKGKSGHWLAILIPLLLTSLLFAIMHGQWNVGVTVFVLSVVMCSLREFTGTIYAGMLVHVIKNCLAFYLLYVAGL